MLISGWHFSSLRKKKTNIFVLWFPSMFCLEIFYLSDCLSVCLTFTAFVSVWIEDARLLASGTSPLSPCSLLSSFSSFPRIYSLCPSALSILSPPRYWPFRFLIDKFSSLDRQWETAETHLYIIKHNSLH